MPNTGSAVFELRNVLAYLEGNGPRSVKLISLHFAVKKKEANYWVTQWVDGGVLQKNTPDASAEDQAVTYECTEAGRKMLVPDVDFGGAELEPPPTLGGDIDALLNVEEQPPPVVSPVWPSKDHPLFKELSAIRDENKFFQRGRGGWFVGNQTILGSSVYPDCVEPGWSFEKAEQMLRQWTLACEDASKLALEQEGNALAEANKEINRLIREVEKEKEKNIDLSQQLNTAKASSSVTAVPNDELERVRKENKILGEQLKVSQETAGREGKRATGFELELQKLRNGTATKPATVPPTAVPPVLLPPLLISRPSRTWNAKTWIAGIAGTIVVIVGTWLVIVSQPASSTKSSQQVQQNAADSKLEAFRKRNQSFMNNKGPK